MSETESGGIYGIVEGFYGRPWNAGQRHRLFGWMRSCGLNSYIYAPKADLKHRSFWRELYDDVESAELAALIRDCHQHGLQFFYSISPGLDIVCSSENDREALHSKLSQAMELGCRNFAVLFDDIPADLSAEDIVRFASLAEAHCHVTNEAAGFIRDRSSESRVIFCPTPYCRQMAQNEPDYLPTLGDRLAEDIEIFWTGPEIVSKTISVDSIRELKQEIRRKPLIWDNLHANDYDLRRLYLGPYSGRPLELRAEVSGILLNPNCQFEANYVPINTFGAFLSSDSRWNPQEACKESVQEWHSEFASDAKSVVELNDLELLVDVFYLPFEFGGKAGEFIESLRYLSFEKDLSSSEQRELIVQVCGKLMNLFSKMCDMRNRNLLHALYPLLWELKEEAALILSFIKSKEQLGEAAEAFKSAEHAPDTYRGGFVATLQRLLIMENNGSFRRVDEKN